MSVVPDTGKASIDGRFGIPDEFMKGAFAPVFEERTSWDLAVDGSIPPELNGLYVRNGANPPPVPYEGIFHWFAPDGMLHGVRFAQGKAVWYRNRWVRTEELARKLPVKAAPGARETGLAPNTSNTGLVLHGGRLLSLVEWGLPYEIDGELETTSRWDFRGELKSTMNAHPRIDPESGVMYFTSAAPMPPYLTLHAVDSGGLLTKSDEISLKGPSLQHDFAITRNNVVFFDLPVVFDAEYLAESSFPFHWDEAYGARIGVMPKAGTGRDVHWFDVTPGYFIHVLNAFEDGDEVVVDAPFYGKVLERGNTDWLRQGKIASLKRWRLNLKTGDVKEVRLTDLSFDFPTLNPRQLGRPYRYGYGVGHFLESDGKVGFADLVQYDVLEGIAMVHKLGDGRVPSEGLFVPRPEGKGENDGWVLSFVYDPERDASDLVIVDATRFDQAPACVIHLPQRVPVGFHGTWMPG